MKCLPFGIILVLLVINITCYDQKSEELEAKYISTSKAFHIMYVLDKYLLRNSTPSIRNLDDTQAKYIEVVFDPKNLTVRGKNSSLLERIQYKVYIDGSSFIITLCLTDIPALEGTFDFKDSCPTPKINHTVALDTHYIKRYQPFRFTYNLSIHKLKKRDIVLKDFMGNLVDYMDASFKSDILTIQGGNSSLLKPTKFKIDIENTSFLIKLCVLNILIVKSRTLTIRPTFDKLNRDRSWCKSPLFDNECLPFRAQSNIQKNSTSLIIKLFSPGKEYRYCIRNPSKILDCWDTLKLRNIQFFIPLQKEVEVDIHTPIEDTSVIEIENVKTKLLVNDNLKLEIRDNKLFLVQKEYKKNDSGEYTLKIIGETIAHISIIATGCRLDESELGSPVDKTAICLHTNKEYSLAELKRISARKYCDKLQMLNQEPRCRSVPRSITYVYTKHRFINNQFVFENYKGKILLNYNSISEQYIAQFIDSDEEGFVCDSIPLYVPYKRCSVGTIQFDKKEAPNVLISLNKIGNINMNVSIVTK